MAALVGRVSRKGDLGSAPASLSEYAAASWHAKVVDLDIFRATRSKHRHNHAGIRPDVRLNFSAPTPKSIAGFYHRIRLAVRKSAWFLRITVSGMPNTGSRRCEHAPVRRPFVFGKRDAEAGRLSVRRRGRAVTRDYASKLRAGAKRLAQSMVGFVSRLRIKKKPRQR